MATKGQILIRIKKLQQTQQYAAPEERLRLVEIIRQLFEELELAEEEEQHEPS